MSQAADMTAGGHAERDDGELLVSVLPHDALVAQHLPAPRRRRAERPC
jgi:hypothetical protein